MNKFTLFWRTGTLEIVHGKDIADAMNRHGYSFGALRALDFWHRGDCKQYAWSATDKKWYFKPKVTNN